ncbi:MAG: protein phosphatase CheZ [Deltaproteobacteria bacterium]
MSSKWNDVMGNIKEELSNLARFVDNTRKGIETFETTVMEGAERIPEASNQLKTVTGDLENAANNIMTILEGLIDENEKIGHKVTALSEWAQALPPAQAANGAELLAGIEALNAATKQRMMEMFGHLSFHDLSGQKLKKVIASFAAVETRLLEMALNLGIEQGAENKGDMLRELKDAGAKTDPLNQNLVDKILKELEA